MRNVWDAVRLPSEEVFALSKLRLKFSKLGMGKYISHLDLLRTFTRAIHRAGLPVRYSQGFNPHQLITFSLPLALGVTSETEFVDIDFEDGTDKELVVSTLNKNLPPDIRILKASIPEIKASTIISAKYKIMIENCEELREEQLRAFFEQKEILAVKKTKKGEKTVNLRDYILSYTFAPLTDGSAVIEIVLSAGGDKNIKPDIVTSKLKAFLNTEKDFEIHRVEIFCQEGKTVKNFC